MSVFFFFFCFLLFVFFFFFFFNDTATTEIYTLSLHDALPICNVRQTDTEMISHVVDGLIARICISLPGACASLDDDAAAAMYENVVKVNNAIGLLQKEEYVRSEEHTSELQSQSTISYAVFCLKKKKK